MEDQTKNFSLSKEKTKAGPIIILLIVGILGITAVALLSSTGRSYLDSVSSSLSFQGNKVSLALAAVDKTYAVGDTVTVSVILNPYKKAITATDVVLQFDPAMVRAVPVDASGKYIDTSDSAFSSFGKVSVDNDKGTFAFSASLEPKGPSNGSGKIADVKFKVLKKGDAKIMFDFTRGSSTDTNVLSLDKKDILEIVKNVDFKVQ